MVGVLVGVVTYDGETSCRDAFFAYLDRMTSVEDVFIVTNSGERDAVDLRKRGDDISKNVTVVVNNDLYDDKIDQIVSNRNMVREYFLDNEYDYLFFLDSDLIGLEDAVEKLLCLNKRLTTGWYLSTFEYDSGFVVRPVSYVNYSGDNVRQLTINELINGGVVELAASGLGCCLIHRDIISNVSFGRDTCSEDVMFFINTKKAGECLYLDTGVPFYHMIYPLGDSRDEALNPSTYVSGVML